MSRENVNATTIIIFPYIIKHRMIRTVITIMLLVITILVVIITVVTMMIIIAKPTRIIISTIVTTQTMQFTKKKVPYFMRSMLQTLDISRSNIIRHRTKGRKLKRHSDYEPTKEIPKLWGIFSDSFWRKDTTRYRDYIYIDLVYRCCGARVISFLSVHAEL